MESSNDKICFLWRISRIAASMQKKERPVNRIEKIRESVDSMLMHTPDAAERRWGYVHLYGVSQACALIAQKRNEDVELATIAGMLHDIYSFSSIDKKDHAHKSAAMARTMMMSLNCFTDHEIDMVVGAIYHHSSKAGTHAPFDEVLIDADVLQHCLYNPLFVVAEHERNRYENLKLEFGYP